MPDQTNRTVLAVVNDLFFSAKISGAAKLAGVALKYVVTEKDLWEKAQAGPSLIIFDLNFTAIEPIQLIVKLKRDPALQRIPLLGFLSHVQTEVQQSAIVAGCDRVMPRSAFSANLNEILNAV